MTSFDKLWAQELAKLNGAKVIAFDPEGLEEYTRRIHAAGHLDGAATTDPGFHALVGLYRKLNKALGEVDAAKDAAIKANDITAACQQAQMGLGLARALTTTSETLAEAIGLRL